METRTEKDKTVPHYGRGMHGGKQEKEVERKHRWPDRKRGL